MTYLSPIAAVCLLTKKQKSAQVQGRAYGLYTAHDAVWRGPQPCDPYGSIQSSAAVSSMGLRSCHCPSAPKYKLGVDWCLRGSKGNQQEKSKLFCNTLKHLPNVEMRFYCPQAFLSLDFQCGGDVAE